jgi:CRP/FNR family cyclic AMP-dependent transcriptional regulator
VEWRLLSSMPEDDRRALLARCQRRRYPKGAFIFHEGEAGDSVHLLDTGTVAIRVTNPLGDVVTLDVLGPGDAFGEQALIGEGSVRSATVVALERAETRRLTREAFLTLWGDHPKAGTAVAQMLDIRLRATSRALVEALFLPAEVRVLRRIAWLADVYADHPSGSIPLTQDDVASMSGTTRQTVNRVLSRAQEEGLVTLSRGRIAIKDREGLVARTR